MAWGYNDYGELGTGAPDADFHPDPALIAGLSGIVSMAGTSGALGSDGQVWWWDGEHRPTVVAGIDAVTKVAGIYARRAMIRTCGWSSAR
jgi:hypothetical protein